jgi:DNA helicase II / ATP-dependent DNA helicase PcrA
MPSPKPDYFDDELDFDLSSISMPPTPPIEAYEGADAGGGDGGGGGGFDWDEVQNEGRYVPAGEAPAGRPSRAQADAEAEAAFQAREEARRLKREEVFSRLNERQALAVHHEPKSVLVLAGAGSGKTSVLTARIAKLVSSGQVPARSILAVTFTNKASMEMTHRLRDLLDARSVRDMWAGTFHSICVKLLRENADAAGLPKTFGILDADLQETLTRGILKDLGLTKAAVKDAAKARAAALATQDLLSTGDVLAAVGGLRAEDVEEDDSASDEFVTPSQCAKYISSRKEAGHKPQPPAKISTRSTDVDQMEAVYAEYQKRCAQGGLLDFQDLLDRGVQLLKDKPEIREGYRDRFQAILVDEFQDTNKIQFEFLQLMKGPRAHVMAVGDDSQSIYGFRGADPSKMFQFVDEMTKDAEAPSGRIVKLEQNYRSLPHILEAANSIISRNPKQLAKTLFTSQADRGEKIDLITFGNGVFEASSIARSIHRMVKEQNVPPSEVAVLYRTNQQSRLLEQELNKLGVPLTVYGGFRFFERQEIKVVMAYLDLVCDITRDLSFAKVANIPKRGLGETTIEELRQMAKGANLSMMEMVGERSKLLLSNPKALGNAAAVKKQRALEQFSDLILNLADEAETVTLAQLIERVLSGSGLAEHYKAEAGGSKAGEDEAEERLKNIAELVSAAKQFELENPEFQTASELLPEYLAYVALMTSTSEADMSKKQTVSLMTVHSSKGLEFDHVFVAGLEEHTFPHGRAIAEDEERGSGKSIDQALREMVGEDPEDDAAAAGDSAEADGEGMQEERRLMYVAVTRARKTLTLSHAMERLNNGEIKICKPSRFLDEIPQRRLHRIDDVKQGAPKRAWPRSHGNREYGGDAYDDSRDAFDQLPDDSIPEMPQMTNCASAPAPFPAAAAAKPWHRHPRSDAGTRPAASSVDRPVPQAPAATAISNQPGSVQADAPEGRKIAIIGTAGRDKDRPMTAVLWRAMVADARSRVRPTDTVISGGAAWADHLAVRLYLDGAVQHLVLHLPAPFDGKQFVGPARKSAGSAANYYHSLFLTNAGVDGLGDIARAIAKGATVTQQPPAEGYEAMFARNSLVAGQATSMLAYTFGESSSPADGGTLNTWNGANHMERHHVALGQLLARKLATADERSGTESAAKPWRRGAAAAASSAGPTVPNEQTQARLQSLGVRKNLLSRPR